MTSTERALDVLARPFDRLLELAVRAPDATETMLGADGGRVRSSALGRLGLFAHLWGAMLIAVLVLDRGGPAWHFLALTVALLGLAWLGRWSVSRHWASGDDPSPWAVVLSTVLPYVGIAVPSVLGIAAATGGLERREPTGVPSLVGPGPGLAAIAAGAYVAGLALSLVRDRLRSTREGSR